MNQDTINKLIELQAEIKLLGTGRESFRARWEFGKLVNEASVSTVMAASITATGRNEIGYRRMAAKRYPTEKALANATSRFSSWSRWTQPYRCHGPEIQSKTGIHRANRKIISRVLELASSGKRVIPAGITSDGGGGDRGRFLAKAAMLPWLTITKTLDGVEFKVDHELKQICDMHQPGAVSEFSLSQHLANLRQEITRVRKEIKCERDRRVWNHPHDPDLLRLIDLVEQRLDMIPSTTTRLAQHRTAVKPNRAAGTETEQQNVEQENCQDTKTHAGTGKAVRFYETSAG